MAIPPLRVLIHSTLVDASNNMLPNLRTYIIWNVRFGSILLKNSFSTNREKISAVIGCDARFKLGGYVEDAMSRCKASWAI